MQSLFDGVAVMVGSEAGRRSKNHRIAGTKAVDSLFVGIESPEDMVIGEVNLSRQDALGMISFVSESGSGNFRSVFKGIGNGNDFLWFSSR